MNLQSMAIESLFDGRNEIRRRAGFRKQLRKQFVAARDFAAFISGSSGLPSAGSTVSGESSFTFLSSSTPFIPGIAYRLRQRQNGCASALQAPSIGPKRRLDGEVPASSRSVARKNEFVVID